MSTTSPANEEFNPYAPPEADLVPPPVQKEGRCYRRGELVVIPHHAQLPPRCIYCNKPTQLRLFRRAVYRPVAWSILSAQDRAALPFSGCQIIIHPATCPLHSAEQNGRIRQVFFLILLSVLACNYSMTLPMGLFGLAACIIRGVILHQKIRIVLADDQNVTLEGCGEPFLASLPLEPEPSP